jgi:cell division protein FtsI (penicillin-binding protein 3)
MGWRFNRLAGRMREAFILRGEKAGGRVILIGLLFALVYATLAGRLIYLGLKQENTGSIARQASSAISGARPDIVDRNGELLATDVRMVSVFAEPRKIIDKDEAIELLTAVLPDLDPKELREKFRKRSGFAWIRREITPRQQAEVHRLGIPGIGFFPENKRVYPNGPQAAHVLGFANVDNVGIAGIEKYIDRSGLLDLNGAGFSMSAADLKPLELSIDLRVQHAMRDELLKAIAHFKAKAGAGVVLDVETGEVIALVSLPDFDPNNPADALTPDRINRINVGVYEMGSTFKALTVAMALDSGKIKPTASLDARRPLMYGRFRIRDYHAKSRVLTVPEVFIYSSNIGTAKMALSVGVEGHKDFLRRAGLLSRTLTELPESANPIVPAKWGELNTMTIAFGHGVAVSPLQAVAATASLMNGGLLIPPTFLKRTPEEARRLATRLIRPETSEALRYVMRLNAVKGSGTRANVPGYFVGAKTGTAEKVVNGRYAKNRLFNTFMAVAPADKPRYLFLTILDEPKAAPETHGYATAGWTNAPLTGRIIERVAPLLGVEPRFEARGNPFPMVSRYGWKLAQ